MALSVIILAAGRGSRMYSEKSKVMHCIAGKPMLGHVVDIAQTLSPDAIYGVVGHAQETIRAHFTSTPVHWIEQKEQLGTAHAVLQVLPYLDPSHQVLILYGDVPLLLPHTLQNLSQLKGDLNLIVAHVQNPQGLGRVIRNKAQDICKIIEEKDATLSEKNVHEIYSGILFTSVKLLNHWLPKVEANNHQREYYLPDIVNMALRSKQVVEVLVSSEEEILGINNKVQLAKAERVFQSRQSEQLMLQGLQLLDPARFDLRGELQFDKDVCIDVNVVLEGKIKLGEGGMIGPNCYLKDVITGKNVVIKSNCIIESAIIEDDCVVGPFARIRPDTHLKPRSHVGNFVEIKKSTLGEGAKVNHLSYIGDADIGPQVNVGAGTITCNYDGTHKHKIVIGEGAFIGSNTSLVAPITIGPRATIGAGSIITKNAPADALTLSRAPQMTVLGWKKKANPDISS